MNPSDPSHQLGASTRSLRHLLLLILLPWVLTNCDNVVGTITYEQPIPPDGIREWIITVTDQQDNPIDGYQLIISAPDTTQTDTINVGGSDYLFKDLISGIYVVQVKKEGYFGNTTQMPIQIPLDRTENYFATTRIRLQVLAPSVAVNNSQGGEATAPGVVETGPRSEEATATIPAGAIPGGGSTTVSFTRIAPSIIATTEDLLAKPADASTLPAELVSEIGFEKLSYFNEIPLDIFYLQVGSQDVTFTSPVKLSMPLGPPQTGQFANVQYVLRRMVGDVSLGRLNPSNDVYSIPFDAEGVGNVNVPRSGVYQVFAVAILETVFARSNRFIIGQTECGRGANFTITSPAAPPVGTYFNFLLILPPRTSAVRNFSVPAVQGARSIVYGYYNYVDYKVSLVLAGVALEIYRFPLTQVSVEQRIINCHNSGGS